MDRARARLTVSLLNELDFAILVHCYASDLRLDRICAQSSCDLTLLLRVLNLGSGLLAPPHQRLSVLDLFGIASALICAPAIILLGLFLVWFCMPNISLSEVFFFVHVGGGHGGFVGGLSGGIGGGPHPYIGIRVLTALFTLCV